ncbi:glycosyltransferase family 2 protein [Sphaerotilus hippei]|uniref:glycosyltransferase family 2 protein n=1 Tax=Sphaerotilus hippei TaxID=744406 RepID=UPI001FE34B70|nr:glycosyltransferase family 2 protein [Sphaerotilus hippei]
MPALRPRISVYVIAFNEAEKIRDAVSSVLWADEIIVADSHSTDGTVEIAEGLGARVVQIDFQGFGDLRNRAIAQCRGDWIFSLDADERCTPEVRDEVLALVDGAARHDAYWVPRRNYFMGRWIRHSGWYPNFRQPQLFRRGAMRYTMEPVHEGYEMLSGGQPGVLRHAISQFPFRNLDEVMRKANRYSTLGAAKVRPGRASMSRALVSATWAFVKHLVFKRGLLDGWAGFIIAFAYFEQTFYRYAKRWEQDMDFQRPPQAPVRRTDRPA